MNCRFCNTTLKHTFCNLGHSPFSNSYLSKDQSDIERTFPLHAFVCSSCYLVQLQEFQTPKEIFNDYAYFSSYSTSWLNHCRDYVNTMRERFKLDATHQIIEIASNDGYLLQYFKQHDCRVLGIEPAANVAQVALEHGIPTLIEFFGADLARTLVNKNIQADLLLGNNVLAHVPNLHHFVEGMKLLLGPKGVITMEFPHLYQLMKFNQFDTIYHEHFSYFSFLTVEKIFHAHGLSIFDVEELQTHGGSLRIYASHENGIFPVQPSVDRLKNFEINAGFQTLETYLSFNEKANQIRKHLSHFIEQVNQNNKTIVAYGAPAKGNTLLNYCGINSKMIAYTVDKSPHKQDKLLPGSKIPIYSPKKIFETKPDFVLILPWNIKNEIIEQMHEITSWGGKFVVPIPQLEVVL